MPIDFCINKLLICVSYKSGETSCHYMVVLPFIGFYVTAFLIDVRGREKILAKISDMRDYDLTAYLNEIVWVRLMMRLILNIIKLIIFIFLLA